MNESIIYQKMFLTLINENQYIHIKAAGFILKFFNTVKGIGNYFDNIFFFIIPMNATALKTPVPL